MENSHFIYRLTPVRPGMVIDEPTEREAAIIGEHFAYLKELTEQGEVLLAGRTLNRDESAFGIVIFRAENHESAVGLMGNDPAVREGIMRAELWPYRVALVGAEWD